MQYFHCVLLILLLNNLNCFALISVSKHAVDASDKLVGCVHCCWVVFIQDEHSCTWSLKEQKTSLWRLFTFSFLQPPSCFRTLCWLKLNKIFFSVWDRRLKRVQCWQTFFSHLKLIKGTFTVIEDVHSLYLRPSAAHVSANWCLISHKNRLLSDSISLICKRLKLKHIVFSAEWNWAEVCIS